MDEKNSWLSIACNPALSPQFLPRPAARTLKPAKTRARTVQSRTQPDPQNPGSNPSLLWIRGVYDEIFIVTAPGGRGGGWETTLLHLVSQVRANVIHPIPSEFPHLLELGAPAACRTNAYKERVFFRCPPYVRVHTDSNSSTQFLPLHGCTLILSSHTYSLRRFLPGHDPG